MKYFVLLGYDYQDKNKAHTHVKVVFRNVDRMIVDDAGREEVISRIREHVKDTNRTHPKCIPLELRISNYTEDMHVCIEGCVGLTIHEAKE